MDEEEKLKKLLHDANQVSRKLDLLLAKGQRQEEKLKDIQDQCSRSKKHKPKYQKNINI